jgi:transcriptional regulator with GAF, ATPase, and Fis domain
LSLVMEALLRPWPGNLRELMMEVRAAARAPDLEQGRVEARHLSERAGLPFAPAPGSFPVSGPAAAAAAASGAAPASPSAPAPAADRETIVAALARAGGNVSGAARILGVHRTQLRRWLARLAIDARAASAAADD